MTVERRVAVRGVCARDHALERRVPRHVGEEVRGLRDARKREQRDERERDGAEALPADCHPPPVTKRHCELSPWFAAQAIT